MRIKVRLNKVTKVEIIGIDAQEARQFLRDLGVTFDTPPLFTAEEQTGIDAIGRFCEQNPSGAEDDSQEVGVNGGTPAWLGKAKETPPVRFDTQHPTGDLFDGDSWTVEPDLDGPPTSGPSPSSEEAKQEVNPPGHLRGPAEIEEDIAAAGRKPFADLPLAAKLDVENQLQGILGQQGPVANMTVTDQQRALTQEVGNQLAYRQWGQQQSILNIAQGTQLAQGEAKTESKPSSPSEPAIEPPAKAEAPSSASLKVPVGVIVSCKGNRWTWRCTVPAWVGSSTQKWPTRDAARQDAIRWLESDPPLADKHGSYDPDVFDRTRERNKWPEGFRIYFALGKWHWENQGDEHGVSIPFATYRDALGSLHRAVSRFADPPEPPSPPPPMAAMLPDAKAKEEAALVAPKEAFYVHPGAGWGPLEDGGLVKHLVCNGKGCTGCDRQGYKRCLEKPKRAFKMF
jgi:hypothetical protein